MKPTILVTGGAGYIGSHTACMLAQRGYNVIILDRLVHGQSWPHSWATLIEGDIGDSELLDTIFSQHAIYAVMHFAAYIEVGASVKDPATYYDNNVCKTLTLLDRMRTHRVQTLVFSSSCAVYGEPHYLPLTEEHPKNPLSPYGTSKLMVEMVLSDYARAYGLRYVALRYFNAAGALPEQGLGEQHEPESHLIPLLLRAVLTKQIFKVFGTDYPTKDGTCIRDYLHVCDIAQAHLLALQHLDDGHPSDVFNLGTGTGVSIRQMIQAVEEITGISARISYEPRRAGDPAVLVANHDKASDILGWQPRWSGLEMILRSALAFEMVRSAGKVSTHSLLAG